MSNRLIGGPGPGQINDIWVYNADTVTIGRGMSCMWDTSVTAVKITDNPMYSGERGPLEGTETANVYGVVLTTATATLIPVGIAQAQIKPGEWGQVRTLGYGVAKVLDTASDNTLTAYGNATTAGWLMEVAPTAVAPCCQIGTSGVTTAGDLRAVFIDALPVKGAMGTAAGRMFGTWI